MANKKFKMNSGSQAFVFALLAGTGIVGMPSMAIAADGEEASANEILVTTARKREESVLDTPISISAMSGEMLAAKGVTTFTDLAQQTPGFNINNNYSGRADRSYAQLIIRGFTSSAPDVSTASMFIDGVPVSSATAISSINNPARVEVLKGPQAAYFGRQTFAGAINVVNSEPGNELSGRLQATLGTRNNYEIYGEVNLPILDDVFSLRLTADKWSKDGSWTNAYNGSTLGDQSSQTFSAFAVIKPASNLKIRLYGMYSKDDDGAAASTILSAYDYTGTDGSSVFVGQSNCTLTGYTATVQGQGTTVQNPFFCGVTPSLAKAPSVNNTYDGVVKDWVDSQTGLLFDGGDHYGLGREFYHFHANVDYDVTDAITLSSLTGYNKEEVWTLLDSDNVGTTAMANTYYAYGIGREYFDYVYMTEGKNKDFSQELRLSYDKGPLVASLGVSYLNATAVTAGGGGLIPYSGYTVKRRGKTQAKTYGIFGAATYTFDNGLSLSAEGRVQWDKLSAYAGLGGVTVANSLVLPVGFYDDGSKLLEKTYVNFMPRLIAQYNIPGSDLMVYASWSKGVNPGKFNTSFLSYTDAVVEQAVANGVGVEVKPEKVTNYELGLKGALFNGAVTFSSAIYFAQWRDQINTIAFPASVTTGTVQLLSGLANTGNVDMKGIELEGSWKVNDIVTLTAAGSINDTDIKDYSYPLTSQLTGVFDFSGKQMPNTSKYSAVAGIALEDNLNASSDATWFFRADYSFKSGVYSDAANVVRTPNRSLVNVRGGFTFGKTRVEAFVKNVFNDKTYTSVYDNYILTPGFAYFSYNSALIVGLPELRTAGMKVSVDF